MSSTKCSVCSGPNSDKKFKTCVECRQADRRNRLKRKNKSVELIRKIVINEEHERQVFYEDAMRRASGLGTMTVSPSTYKRCKGDELLPLKPFQQWIENRLQVYESIEDFASIIETSPRTILRWRTGREVDRGKERKFNQIPLNTVDLALTREGSKGLWELYPELYK